MKKSKLFISGSVKQSGNGYVTSTKVKRKKKPFDFDAPETRNVTLADILKQKSIYEV